MGALSGLVNLTRGALEADQAGLSATGNNIANQNTVGYTRQVARFQAGDSVTLSNGAQIAVSAPSVTVSSVRSRALDKQLQTLTQVQAATAASASVLSQVESVFGLAGSSATAGSTEIGTALNGLFTSLTALSASPADTATREGVLAAAGTLSAAFNGAAAQLKTVGTDLDGSVKSSIAQVNALTAQIAGLNGQIAARGESPDAGTGTVADAGPLEDQRQAAITQLSGLIGLDQITTEGDGISLTTTGGATLVSGLQAATLSAFSTAGGTQIENTATGAALNATITGGSIGGQLATQATTLPQTAAALDALAYRIGSAVNSVNEAGTDLNGAPGVALFSLPSTASGAAGAISVATADPGAIAASGPGEGSAGNTNANALAALAQATDAAGQTVSGNLSALLSTVGSSSAALAQTNTAQSASLASLTSQVSSLSGVSLDEEAANLSQYQQSYEAAAKVFSILNTVLAAAINLGTETTVS